MGWTTLIDTGVLAARLGDQAVAIVDCRYNLDNENWGAKQYRSAHIPGAAYAHLGHDLAGAKTGTNGRHPLPDVTAVRRTFSRLGIARDVQVVAYDQDSGMFASRLWWLLRWLGHDASAVLDGGFAQWTAEARPIVRGTEAPAPQPFSGSPRNEMVVDVAQTAALVGRRDWRLVDARVSEIMPITS